MFSGSPYVGTDGGFHGVFGHGTPDIDDHPESAKSRAAWLSVEDEQESADTPPGAAQMSLAEILNQRDRDLVVKRNKMVQDNLEPARRMLQSLQETIGIDTEPTEEAPLVEQAAARTASATGDESSSAALSLQPKTSSGRSVAVNQRAVERRATVGLAGSSSTLHSSPRTEKDVGATRSKVPMSRELLRQQFVAENSETLAAASRMWNFGAELGQSSMAMYLYEIGLFDHTESIEKAFEALFPNHPVSKASLMAMGKLDLDRLIRTAGVNPHDAKKLRACVLGTAGPRSAPGDEHFDEHFDPSRVKVSNTPWDESANDHQATLDDSVLRFEGSVERRLDSTVIKSPALGGEGLSFRSGGRKKSQSEDSSSSRNEVELLSIRGMRGPTDLTAYQQWVTSVGQTQRNDLGGHKARLAAKEGKLEGLRALLDKHSGAETSYDQQGRTPLFLAAEAGHSDCVDELLRRGSDPNLYAHSSEGKHSPLTVATMNGHQACVKLLLGKGAHPDHVSEHPESSGSALVLAVNAGHIPCVRALLVHKADTEIPNKSGHRPLFSAAARGRLDCLNALLENGAKTDAEHEASGRTAFMVACQLGREDCVIALVAAQCNKDMSDCKGQTGLMLACSMGHRIIVEYLVNGGCNLDMSDCKGQTGLMLACSMGHRIIVEYLVNGGCNLEARDNEGKTASDLAKAGDVTEYFKERSAGAAEELMAMLEQEEVDVQTKEKVKKKKKQKRRKQKQQGSKAELEPELQPEPEPELELEFESPSKLDTKSEQGPGTKPEALTCAEHQTKSLAACLESATPSEHEADGANTSDEVQVAPPPTAEYEVQEGRYDLKLALQPKTKRKHKKKTRNVAGADTAGEELGSTGSSVRSGDDELRQLRQGLTVVTTDKDQQAQRQLSALKRENKALQWKVEALEQRLAKQTSEMAAQEADFSARIEESWQDSIKLREETAALQRVCNIAQHEAAQYRRQKEELESALAEKKDETDVSLRARNESEILLMNENQRLRAENKELNEVLEKERTSATHANQQFQAHMQQMNRASFDQGTRLQQANNIIRQFQTGNAIEHADMDALRRQRADYMLHQLQIITNTWIHDIGDARGVHQAGATQLRAYLFTFGSFRLEVDDASSDVDVLVMVPPLVDRETDFFGLGPDRTYQCPSLLARLEQDERVRGMVAVVDAYVPCIKMSFGGIDFDLTFANVLRSDLPQQSEWGDDVNSWRAGPGNYAVDGAMHALGHDLPAVRSFVGVHATHFVLRLMQQHYDTFRQTLVHVKAWAKQQGIYGSMMGYPGGVAWTLLTAFYCRQRFSAMPSGSHAPPTVGSILAGFFTTWAEWQWPKPVELVDRSPPTEQQHSVLDAEVWRPGSGGSTGTRDALMPIISPAYPQMNTTHTVGAASFRVIQEELSAAASLNSAAGIGGCYSLDEWLEICSQQEPTHRKFLRRYPSYLYIEVSADRGNPRRSQWFALAKARLRHIVTTLENRDELAIAHLFPSPFSPETMELPSATGPATGAEFDAPLLFCVGFSLAEAVAGRGNVEHVELVCVGAVEEVAAQITTKAQRGHWHTPDMRCTGRVVPANKPTSVKTQD